MSRNKRYTKYTDAKYRRPTDDPEFKEADDGSVWSFTIAWQTPWTFTSRPYSNVKLQYDRLIRALTIEGFPPDLSGDGWGYVYLHGTFQHVDESRTKITDILDDHLEPFAYQISKYPPTELTAKVEDEDEEEDDDGMGGTKTY